MIEAMSRDAQHLNGTEKASLALHEATSPGEPMPCQEPTGHDTRCPHRVVPASGMVMTYHACHVEVFMQTGPLTGRLTVRDHAGLDHVLDLITAYAHAWAYNPTICVLPSLRPLPEDAYGNQLRLDYDPATGSVRSPARWSLARAPGCGSPEALQHCRSGP